MTTASSKYLKASTTNNLVKDKNTLKRDMASDNGSVSSSKDAKGAQSSQNSDSDSSDSSDSSEQAIGAYSPAKKTRGKQIRSIT